jgi:predicted amidohydrolase YtcJ
MFLLHKNFSGYTKLTLLVLYLVPIWLTQLGYAADQGARVGEADAVYQNGFVYTVDAQASRAQAFAVRDGKFLKIGTNEDMKPLTGPDTKVVDLKGKMVMPGVVDGHIHALRGALTKMGVAFEANATLEEIKSAVTKWMKDNKVKKGDWVEGGKWGLPFDKINASMLDDIAPDTRPCWTTSRPTTRYFCTTGLTT